MFPRVPPPAFLDLTRPDPRADLALDEALVRTVNDRPGDRTRQGVLRVWERRSYCVVLGRANRVALNVNLPACEAAGVPVLRRASGGGTVLLGPGALCWSLVLPVGPPGGVPGDIPTVTAAIMRRLADAVRPAVPGAGVDGTSDLTVPAAPSPSPYPRTGGTRVKVGGNAQRWLRSAMLHHGTLLYDFDLSAVPRFLTAPERQPDYRAGRDHAAFLTNLPLPRPALVAALKAAFGAGGPAEVPLTLAAELDRVRYSDPAWHLRR